MPELDFFNAAIPTIADNPQNMNAKQAALYAVIVEGKKSNVLGLTKRDLSVFSKAQLQAIGREMHIQSRAITYTSTKKDDIINAIFSHMEDVVLNDGKYPNRKQFFVHGTSAA